MYGYMHDSVQTSKNYLKWQLNQSIYHITKHILQECKGNNQQDKTQPLMKIVQNRNNGIANGMKQVRQCGWIIAQNLLFTATVPVKNCFDPHVSMIHLQYCSKHIFTRLTAFVIHGSFPLAWCKANLSRWVGMFWTPKWDRGFIWWCACSTYICLSYLVQANNPLVQCAHMTIPTSRHQAAH